MKLIDKAVLVAEIERISCENPMDDSWYVDTEELLNFLDTLEVKEVDLEKEIEKVKKMYNCLELKEETIIDFCAKHFFELGLKAQKL